MIQLTESIWIGNSIDEKTADLVNVKVSAVLNVAQDLHGERGWSDGIEYAQVGLIDGPGNPLSAYYAAVLTLATLSKRKRVMVCCHTGGRSIAVVLMYLRLMNGEGVSWENQLEILHERVDIELPVPHNAHKEAFNRMKWRSLANLVGG